MLAAFLARFVFPYSRAPFPRDKASSLQRWELMKARWEVGEAKEEEEAEDVGEVEEAEDVGKVQKA